MQWTEDFESGLPDIDVQHRYIFALIQRVLELKERDEQPNCKALLNELIQFAYCHFECEERLMATYGYGGISQHVTEHAKLLYEVSRFQRGAEIDARQLSLFLCNWVVSHTQLEDRKLAEHVLRARAAVLGSSMSKYIVTATAPYRPSGIVRLPSRKVSGG